MEKNNITKHDLFEKLEEMAGSKDADAGEVVKLLFDCCLKCLTEAIEKDQPEEDE